VLVATVCHFRPVGKPAPPRTCGEPEHAAQDEHGALARWQVLQRDDERQLDRLALLVAGLTRR
jgi:hypothetical protein